MNFYNLYSIVIFNEPFIRLMSLKHVKIGRAVIFMKYLASVVFMIFLPETLIWNKTRFRHQICRILHKWW